MFEAVVAYPAHPIHVSAAVDFSQLDNKFINPTEQVSIASPWFQPLVKVVDRPIAARVPFRDDQHLSRILLHFCFCASQLACAVWLCP